MAGKIEYIEALEKKEVSGILNPLVKEGFFPVFLIFH